VLRYNANGSLDTTGFGAPNGYVIGTIGKGNATDTCALALQGTNVVVAGGSSDGNVVLYRYDTTGTLDATFGTGGKTATAIGLIARPPAIALQSTGKIVVATGNDVDQVVLRYSADGILDATFGNAATPGKVVTDIGGATNFGNAIAAQSNDKIVVLGHANVDIAHDTSDITLVRFGADGALDTNFNSTGIVTTDLAGRFDNGLAVVLQEQPPADAAVVVAGNTGRAGFTQIVVLRYKNDGSLDTSFGPTQEGVVLVNVVGPGTVASANAVALQAVGTGVGIVTAGFD
jgi:uncharacterized delta-60 repeat protein